LEKLSGSRTSAHEQVERAMIWLRAASGEAIAALAVGVGRRPETVWKVVKRFNQRGLASLHEHGYTGRG